MQEYIKKGSGHNRPSSSALHNTTLMISNDEINDTIKIIKSLEYSGLLLKGVTEIGQNEVKEQKGGFRSILLGTLGACLLGNFLTGREVIANRQGQGICRAQKGKGKEVLRVGYGHPLQNKMDF